MAIVFDEDSFKHFKFQLTTLSITGIRSQLIAVAHFLKSVSFYSLCLPYKLNVRRFRYLRDQLPQEHPPSAEATPIEQGRQQVVRDKRGAFRSHPRNQPHGDRVWYLPAAGHAHQDQPLQGRAANVQTEGGRSRENCQRVAETPAQRLDILEGRGGRRRPAAGGKAANVLGGGHVQRGGPGYQDQQRKIDEEHRADGGYQQQPDCCSETAGIYPEQAEQEQVHVVGYYLHPHRSGRLRDLHLRGLIVHSSLPSLLPNAELPLAMAAYFNNCFIVMIDQCHLIDKLLFLRGNEEPSWLGVCSGGQSRQLRWSCESGAVGLRISYPLKLQYGFINQVLQHLVATINKSPLLSFLVKVDFDAHSPLLLTFYHTILMPLVEKDEDCPQPSTERIFALPDMIYRKIVVICEAYTIRHSQFAKAYELLDLIGQISQEIALFVQEIQLISQKMQKNQQGVQECPLSEGGEGCGEAHDSF